MAEFIARKSKEIVYAVRFNGSLSSKIELELFADNYGVLDVIIEGTHNDRFKASVKGRSYEDIYFLWNEKTLALEPVFVQDFSSAYVKLTDANKQYGNRI